ncbi:Ff.00g123780.m01.CDS01 [Fusarium sp. VM40]|nr:Ff.00g123780.m01.CDS01 [Fusarium sp. VM40]
MRFAPADLPSVYYMYQVFQMKLLTSAVAITKKPPSRTRDSSKTKRNDEVTATQRLKHVEISFKDCFPAPIDLPALTTPKKHRKPNPIISYPIGSNIQYTFLPNGQISVVAATAAKLRRYQ